MNILRVIDTVDGTTVDGIGFRTSIYFAGCRHRCPGCHNPSTWDFAAGCDVSIEELMAIITKNDMNVTFSGGDPIFQAEVLLPLAKEIAKSGKTIWCYTGFTYEQLLTMPHASELLDYIEVLVDGRFIEQLRDTELLFRGSSNQRLIDVKATRRSGKIVEWVSDF